MNIRDSVAFVTGGNRALETGDEDIFPDPMSQQLYSRWRTDHKVVERLFAAM